MLWSQLPRAFSGSILACCRYRSRTALVHSQQRFLAAVKEAPAPPSEPYAVPSKGRTVTASRRGATPRDMSRLLRLLRKEGLPERWRAKVYHTSPSEQRKLDGERAEQKLKRARFRFLMRAILQRKERGF